MAITPVSILSAPIAGQPSGVIAGTGLSIAADGTISIANNSIVNAMVNSNAGIASTKLTYLSTGAGAVSRTVSSKLSDWVSVKDYGAVGDGTTDDTTAINAAISATTGVVFFPEGQYIVATGITINKKIKLLGTGFGSQITYTGSGTLLTLQYSDFTQTGPQFEIESISLYNSTTISDCCIELEYTGAAAIVGGYDKLYLTNVYINTASYWRKGLFLNRSAGVYAVNTSILNNNNGAAEIVPGVYGIHALNDLAGHNMIRTFSAANLYVQRFYRCMYFECLPIANAIESLYVVNAELLGNYGLYMDGEVAAISFATTHMDLITQAIYAPKAQTMRFSGCDIRPGRGGAGITTPGIVIGDNSGSSGQFTSFVGNLFVSSNNKIIQINGGVEHLIVGNNFLGGNSNTAVEVNNPAVNVMVAANNTSNTGTAYINNATSTTVTIGQTGSWVTGARTLTFNNGILATVV